MASRKRPSLRENIVPAVATPLDPVPGPELGPEPSEPGPDGDVTVDVAADSVAPASPVTGSAEPDPAAALAAPALEAPASAAPVQPGPSAAEAPAAEPPAPAVAEAPPAGPLAAAPSTEPAAPQRVPDPVPLAAAPVEPPSTTETVVSSSLSEPVVPPPPAPAAPRSSGAVALASIALVVSIAGVGALVTQPLWLPEAKRQKVATLALTDRVSSLETRLGTAAAGASLSDRVAALETSLAALDRKVAALPDGKAVGALAMAELRDALEDSDPFAAELVAVRASGIADETLTKALDKLTPYAATGVPTREQLAARFLLAVPEVLAADARAAETAKAKAAEAAAAQSSQAPQPPQAAQTPAADAAGQPADGSTAVAEGPGLGERVWGLVSGAAGLLSFTAVNAVEGRGAAGAVQKAGVLVAGGELAAAVELMVTLEGEAAQAAGPWLADARARLAADEAVSLMTARSAALLPARS